MRQPTLQTLGLGSVLDVFRRGGTPVDRAELVERSEIDAGFEQKALEAA